MTPFEIEVIMHYYTSPSQYKAKATSALMESTYTYFLDIGVLEAEGNFEYSITGIGKAYCKGLTLLEIPVPKIIWEFHIPNIEDFDGDLS